MSFEEKGLKLRCLFVCLLDLEAENDLPPLPFASKVFGGVSAPLDTLRTQQRITYGAILYGTVL